jgi:hypothetical protein
MKILIETTLETKINTEVEIQFPYFIKEKTYDCCSKITEQDGVLRQYVITNFMDNTSRINVWTSQEIIKKDIAQHEAISEDVFLKAAERAKANNDAFFASIGLGDPAPREFVLEGLKRDEHYNH